MEAQEVIETAAGHTCTPSFERVAQDPEKKYIEDAGEASPGAHYFNSLRCISSKNQIYKSFRSAEILKYLRPQPEIPKLRCKYEASFVNLIWHADIHFLTKDNNSLLYAIIDDASRFIVGWDILGSKHAVATCAVAKKAMKRFGKPYTFWTDNGGENRGRFKQYLEKHTIYSVFTEPYKPEQNGKIERFWPLLEVNCDIAADIPRFICEYNTTPHSSLPINKDIQNFECPMSPEIADRRIPRFQFDTTPRWKMNGVERNFNPFIL
jgi:transposase InsO family protein